MENILSKQIEFYKEHGGQDVLWLCNKNIVYHDTEFFLKGKKYKQVLEDPITLIDESNELSKVGVWIKHFTKVTNTVTIEDKFKSDLKSLIDKITEGNYLLSHESKESLIKGVFALSSKLLTDYHNTAKTACYDANNNVEDYFKEHIDI